jgi:HK97 family phage major capsid protein
MNFDQLVQKTDLALSDLASGGLLQPEQSDRFFRKLIDAPTILNEARFVKMNKPKMEINKIGFGSRMLRAANQGNISSPRSGEEGTRALARADRTKPTTGKITLDTKEVIAEINIPYEVLEQNIEGENLESTIIDMIAERAALDLEEKLILGDESSGDAFLALDDGLLEAISTNTVNHNGAGINASLFGNMVKALPTKYHRLLKDFRFYTSVTKEIDYRMIVANRQTSLGDATLTGMAPVAVHGVQLKGAALMPNANVVLMNPKNYIVGMQRQLRMEVDKDIRERAIVIVLTMTVDHKLEEEDMTVKATNVG